MIAILNYIGKNLLPSGSSSSLIFPKEFLLILNLRNKSHEKYPNQILSIKSQAIVAHKD